MTDPFAGAIEALQNDLAKLDMQARGIKNAINVLCKSAGKDEIYPNVAEEAGGRSVSSIKADSFYGKTIGAAAREYLEMRRSSGLGPATPKEIYDALIQGGLQFETANETNAQISLSNTLRKNSKMFHKLPNGGYGLLSWYPNAKDKGANDKSAASTEPAADEVSSSDAPLNDQEEGASEPMEKED